MIYALCIFFGFMLAVGLNRARWAIFPMSGGPRWAATDRPVFGFLGQAPEQPRHRYEPCERCGRCRRCVAASNHEPEIFGGAS